MIVINTNARDVLRQVRSLAERGLGVAIARAMDSQNSLTAGHIVQFRMSGPSSATAGILGARTRHAGRSVEAWAKGTAGKARVRGNTVISSIGSPVHYVATHEFGFSGPVQVGQHTRRVKSRDVRVKRKRVASGIAMVTAHTRNVNIPARHMIERGVKDKEKQYGDAISTAIVNAWNGRR